MTAGAGALAESTFKFETTPGQLPKSVYPFDYALRLQPDLEKFTTKGWETIDVEVLKPVTEIVLNALEMEVTKATLISTNGELTLRPRVNPTKQTLTLLPPSEVAPGKYRIALEFNGRIDERAQGLYHAEYPSPSGRKTMLGTQMEPTDARRMFPCWDEPVFRARFELTVLVPEKHLAVSNMPIEREAKLGNGLKEVKFMRTPPMATYLVLFVSGELEELKGEAEGVKIRIITTEGKRDQGHHALDSTKKLLAYYNRYFGVRYPLPKLDQIAIPGGFGGAMENWGGITYNERNLLFDPKTSSQATRQSVFGIIAHEMAHQWFGDLVTTAWWDNLWLNEGFASWMASKATDKLNPDWQVWLAAGSVKSGVMNDDALSSTHPILRPINNENEANDAFDQITYQKGQSFLRMLENFLGEDAFRNGIRQYMAKHKYSNATTADLWDSLEISSGKPVKAISAGWTEQPGFPLITIKTNCDAGKQIVTLEQERFTVQDPNAKPLLWQVPVALMDVAEPKYRGFAFLDGRTVSVPFRGCNDIIKANAGDAGYYRVAYEPELFEKLRQRLNELPPADRLNLLNDSWAMVVANRGPISGYLDLAKSLKGEKTFAIWSQVISVLGFIDSMEKDQAGRAAFRDFACRLLQPELKRLTWKAKSGESNADTLLRSQVISTLGAFGDKAVIAEAQARYAKFIAKPSSLPADLRAPVLIITGRYADRATYDQLHELARKAKGTEERQLYYRAMAGALDPELAASTLSLSLSGETIPQETANFPAQVAGLGGHTDLAWDFAKQHMKELLNQVEAFRRNGYVPGIMSGYCDAARADELEAYVKKNVSEEALPKARETAASIRLKADIKKRELANVDKWVSAVPSSPDKL